MTQEEKRPVYIGYEKKWTARPCPECGRTATGHGFLYWEEPPQPAIDERRPFAHVYMHMAPA